MVKIIPFQAVRPRRDLVHLVTSMPYYKYPKHILEALLDSNPYSFIHIINPEFTEQQGKTMPNSTERFEKVRARYDEFKRSEYFLKEEKPCYYLYRQTNGANVYCGVIAGVAIENYVNGVVKIHEDTLSRRVETFQKYLEICKFNAEPVLITHEDRKELQDLKEQYYDVRPEYEHTTPNGVKHELWVISSQEDQGILQVVFEGMRNVYLADGHHRSESSAQLHAVNKDVDSFMAYLIPESDLKIYDYNRVVDYTQDLSIDEVLDRISSNFDCVLVSEEGAAPSRIHEFALYGDGQWYKLTLRNNSFDDPVRNLDSAILSELVLDPVFEIKDLRLDDRVRFVEGVRGLNALSEDVDSGRSKIAFALFPVTLDQMKAVADANKIMPPKSTWIEPKLRSGLTIYEWD